jgi:ABC-type branched-subunit amino acid transport system ATPase component
LDEPTEGLAPVIVEQICAVVKDMKKKHGWPTNVTVR